MRNFLFLLFIIIGVVLVLYLSWVSSPKIGGNQLIPSWMGSWVDSDKYFTIRTAIPLIFLGAMSGVIIHFNRLGKAWLWYSWILLSFVVLIAEVGQFLRPLRSFDIEDIIMGSVGAALGLLSIVILSILLKFLKAK